MARHDLNDPSSLDKSQTNQGSGVPQFRVFPNCPTTARSLKLQQAKATPPELGIFPHASLRDLSGGGFFISCCITNPLPILPDAMTGHVAPFGCNVVQTLRCAASLADDRIERPCQCRTR